MHTAHHSSGFEHSTKPRRFHDRYPYTTCVIWLLTCLVCIGWLLTHAGCAHPIENALASLVGFGFAPLRLLFLVLGEAGIEE